MRRPILNTEARQGQNVQEQEDVGEDDVEELQRMMVRLQAARGMCAVRSFDSVYIDQRLCSDMGADLPLTERRKLAAQAVKDVMRTA